jgi:hypothetical protein
LFDYSTELISLFDYPRNLLCYIPLITFILTHTSVHPSPQPTQLISCTRNIQTHQTHSPTTLPSISAPFPLLPHAFQPQRTRRNPRLTPFPLRLPEASGEPNRAVSRMMCSNSPCLRVSVLDMKRVGRWCGDGGSEAAPGHRGINCDCFRSEV